MSSLTEPGTALAATAGSSRQVGEILLWALREPVTAGEAPPLPPEVAEPLVHAAVRHGVAGLLHEALRKCGLLDELGPWKEDLTRWRFRAAAQQLLASADLRTVSLALGSAGIPWVVMKGPVIAALGYGDPTLRWSCDLDILVSPKDFGKAIDELVARGTTLLDLNWGLQLSLWRAEASLRLPLGTMLDLHWHPVNDARARMATTLETVDLLGRRRFIVSRDGATLPAFDAVDDLITVALHASLSGGHRLIWAKDLERLCREDPPDWDEVLRRAHTAKVGPPVGIMLLRARRLLRASAPADVAAALVGTQPIAGLFTLGERLASPVALGRGSHTGIAFMCSLRGTPAASVDALARTWGRQLLAAARRAPYLFGGPKRGLQRAPRINNPLRWPSEGTRAQCSYLEAVADYRNVALRRRLLRKLPRSTKSTAEASLAGR